MSVCAWIGVTVTLDGIIEFQFLWLDCTAENIVLHCPLVTPWLQLNVAVDWAVLADAVWTNCRLVKLAASCQLDYRMHGILWLA